MSPLSRSVTPQEVPPALRSGFLRPAISIGVLTVLLFFSGNRTLGPYDEPMMLTAALRTMAGQVFHRDFYYAYGPAQLFILAALFKIFGVSLFVARLLTSLWGAATTVIVYFILKKYCRLPITLLATLTGTLLAVGLGVSGSPVLPLLLVSVYLALLQARSTNGNALFAGLINGVTFLFRYDFGIALCMMHVMLLLVGLFLGDPIRGMLRKIGLLCSAFLAVVSIPVILYLAVAGTSDVTYDILTYPRLYYRAARGLPFPHLLSKNIENWAIYLPLIVISLCTILAARYVLTEKVSRERLSGDPLPATFAITFGAAILLTYAKAYVRISAGQLYPCLLLSLMLLALLIQHRSELAFPFRAVVVALAGVMFLLAIVVSKHYWTDLRRNGNLMFGTSHYQDESVWCGEKNPVTYLYCFIGSESDMQTTEYLAPRLAPHDSLYEGLPRHDRVFVNDNFLYFSTNHLPATKWSQFDPDVQNTLQVQKDMVSELSRARPPYIVESSEFDNYVEPNDSSRSSGVHLLDDYITSNYRVDATIGTNTVLVRK